MTIPPDLLLPDRTGLPAEIAYLRATWPAPTWRAHDNFGELAAFWLRVHAHLREQGEALQRIVSSFREHRADAESFQRLFVPRLNHFLQHLNGHHQIEDAAYFPKFRALDPRMIAGFDLLESDHAIIHDALTASIDTARALLAALPGDDDTRRHMTDRHAEAADRLHALLGRHLADEEDLVIPAMLEHGERSVG
ncbi:hemerythrin domain-containing protein [Sphingomonas sp. AR_OL41]|uniref:hemerythrin domain-containing protein n=1 Tax=Sphingomonas sp. AR_OL41 TaxID=3042729 RepID=UPI0024804A18|nr:hemerythrin domain-containing protein [Sphingomonas sp. AR_OL41]MDH7975380.1 hemerythrin domain-containing protein [Sphingomonas sp. AR_OL41]